MKLTNKLNLPQALVTAVSNDPYKASRGTAWRTIGQLISPPRQIVLRARHEEEVTEDVAERLYALFGQIVHSVIERGNIASLVEHRLSMEVLGKTISGQLDSFELVDGVLTDWKYSTAWKAKGQTPAEWVEQLNLQAVLLRNAGYKVGRAEVVLLMRDHSKLEALRDAEYPQLPIARLPVPLFEPDRALAFMQKRVSLHLAAETELPECSFEERWAKPDIFAVKKTGAERATKLHYTLEDAEAHIAREPKLVIEKRAGQNVRCESYCPVSQFCTQYQQLKNGDNK